MSTKFPYFVKTKRGQWMTVGPKGARFSAPPSSSWIDRYGKRHKAPKPVAKKKRKRGKRTKVNRWAGTPRPPDRIRKAIGKLIDKELRLSTFRDKTSRKETVWRAVWEWRWPHEGRNQIGWDQISEFLELAANKIKADGWAVQIHAWFQFVLQRSGKVETWTRPLAHSWHWRAACHQAASEAVHWEQRYDKTRVLGLTFWLRAGTNDESIVESAL